MSDTTFPPLVLTSSGPLPQTPAALNQQTIALATALAPGLTILPAALIEDLASTAAGALAVIDNARVDLINSVSPNAANPFILNLLGQMYGVSQGLGTNTGVFVVFSGPVGYVVRAGFIVSDGTYQYSVQDANIVRSSGTTQPVSAVATQSGTWAVSPNTVMQIATSVPSTLSPPLTVTNPLFGTPGLGVQTVEDYRSQVFTAGKATFTGSIASLKTALGNITGVNPNLVAVQQQTTNGWKVLVGGSGDPYQIGFAILSSLFDISTLVGSTLLASGITNASPAVVTTNLNHGFTSGQIIQINGANGMATVNTQNFPATVLTPTTFSIPFNGITAGTYTGGGVVTPNFRNVSVNIYDYPDTYTIPFVVPPSQTVTMVITWATTSTGFVSAPAVAAAVQPAVANYINTIPVGQPINLFVIQETFQQAVASLVPAQLLTKLNITVSINGVGVTPLTGTFSVLGDPESYFTTTTAAIVVNQG